MTKRFKISIGESEEENISDTVKNIEITEISDMCTQMNTLYEENEQLKQENNNLRIALRYELEKDLPSAPVGHCRCTPEPYRSDENE